MPELKPDWSDPAVRASVPVEISGLPPNARPGSATLERAAAMAAQIGQNGQEALRNPWPPDEGEPDCV